MKQSPWDMSRAPAVSLLWWFTFERSQGYKEEGLGAHTLSDILHLFSTIPDSGKLFSSR
jgi:hypothetical protein